MKIDKSFVRNTCMYLVDKLNKKRYQPKKKKKKKNIKEVQLNTKI